MTNLERAKKIIKKYYWEGNCGLFDSRNVVGDDMTMLYSSDTLRIDICYQWMYFEVFGLTDDEWEKLAIYYEELGKGA